MLSIVDSKDRLCTDGSRGREEEESVCVTYDGDLSVIHLWFDTFVDLQRGGACGGAPV